MTTKSAKISRMGFCIITIALASLTGCGGGLSQSTAAGPMATDGGGTTASGGSAVISTAAPVAAPAPLPASPQVPVVLPDTPVVPAPTPVVEMPAPVPVPSPAVAPLVAHGGIVVDISRLPAHMPGVSTPMLTASGSVPPANADPYEDGAFRLLCNWSKISYDDPMVYPGKPGLAHLHTFFGNTAIDAFTTIENIRSKGNASCRGGTVNLSGYWVPTMINVDTSQPILPKDLLVYYKTGTWTWMGDMAANPIQPIPRGLRMIVGDPSATTPNGNAWFGCMMQPNGDARPGSGGKTIPTCMAGDTLRVGIDFPQCWDGVNLDSPDHKSHMSRPVEWWDDPATRGQRSPDASRPYKCPADHPVVLPLITFNTDYPVGPGDDTSKWRLASDTYDRSLPGGYSVHADWMNGWDQAISDIWGIKCLRERRNCGSFNVGDGRGAIEFQGN